MTSFDPNLVKKPQLSSTMRSNVTAVRYHRAIQLCATRCLFFSIYRSVIMRASSLAK